MATPLTRAVVIVALVFLAFCCAIHGSKSDKKYEPSWKSIDTRPLPTWYDEAKFGIFLHWGVFSVPSLNDEWFWNFWKVRKVKEVTEFMKKFYPPTFTYQDFAAQFKAEFYDPHRWVDIFKAAGARYVVLTTKHHEGFTMWPSKYSWNWNAMDVGPNRNLVGDFVDAVRNFSDIRVGLYHSLYEWFNPLYLQDRDNNFTTREYALNKAFPELYELVNEFKPDLIWSDGDSGPDSYWRSPEFLAWLYNESPVKDEIVVNDRWFSWANNHSACHHGGYFTCNDRYSPGHLVNHKWEDATTLDKRSWGFRRNMMLSEVLTTKQVISQMAETVSYGGNFLLNVGPTESGVIPVIFEQRLREIGSWLKVNGEAIYGTKPSSAHQNDTITPHIWYTTKKSSSGLSVYAIALDWPATQKLTLGALKSSDVQKISLLGYAGSLDWSSRPGGGVIIKVPTISFKDMPCDWAWVFKIDV